MPTVFLSHSSKDNAFVQQFAADLERADLDVWLDLDDIDDGERWLQEIEVAIRDSFAIVIVMSVAARASEWVEREALFALQWRKPIFIAQIEDVPLPLHLINLQYTDFSDYDAGLTSLIDAIRNLSGADLPREKRNLPDDISLDPNEDNFFDYMAQVDDGEEQSLLARDLYRWAQKQTDVITFGGRHTPCFHARMTVGDKSVTVFSVLAYMRNPAVQIPMDYLSKYAPFTAYNERLAVINQLNAMLPDAAQFKDERANRRPTIDLSLMLTDADPLEQLKAVISGIINRLRHA